MIKHHIFPIDEWSIREEQFHLDILAQTESIFALSNGHIGLRGNLDEGEPYGLPGTYLNGVYELRPFPYVEPGFGDPESGQTIINATNGKLIRLLVEGEPFDLRYGEIQHHERELDLRDGVLRRRVCWTSPLGHTVKVSSVRMVPFTQRTIVAISYEVEPLDTPVRVVLQSELVANEMLPELEQDPRAGFVPPSKLVSEEHLTLGTLGLLIHRIPVSNIRIGVAMDHRIMGPAETIIENRSFPDVARVSATARLVPGEKLRIIKLIAYAWSNERSRPAIHDQVVALLSAAWQTSWEGLLAEQRAYLDDFWARADVEIEGDPEIQQAVRFALFHVLQAGSHGRARMIPAKGLTGPGYDGHAFWDTEIYVLPMLTLIMPRATAAALRWRHSTLALAKKRAHQLGLRGAAFPWRTIRGEECSGYWPASTAAFHVNADIAYAVTYYIAATGDTAFEATVGIELLVETARLWRSLGHFDARGQFRIDGVTGPDEYSAVVDNNTYTNLLAQHNLRAAIKTAKRYPQAAQALGVDDSELTNWRDAAERILIPYDMHLKVTQQNDTSTEHEVWDFASTTPDQYPLFLHFPYFHLYRKQVVKQADLVLAMLLRGDAFTAEQKARNFAYYESLTVRDSSLSATAQAIMAAELGHLQLAYDYLGETALVDLRDLQHNVKDGIHLAALAGTWLTLVMGFGGLRIHHGSPFFSPRLPDRITRLVYHIVFRGSLRVEVGPAEVTYRLLDGSPLDVWHYGDKITLSMDKAVTRPIPPLQARTQPTQPPGRKPIAREIRQFLL